VKVRAVIKLIEVDGWRLVRQTGSHRQFRHPIKPGTVDGCWEAEHGRASGNAGQHSPASRVEGTEAVSGYAVVIEQGEASFGAYVPELPGLGVAGSSVEEVERLIREAIPLHIESLRAHGDPVPPPSTVAAMVVPAPAALASNASDG
jgi:predicted RNase H-like HicB family nuclease